MANTRGHVCLFRTRGVIVRIRQVLAWKWIMAVVVQVKFPNTKRDAWLVCVYFCTYVGVCDAMVIVVGAWIASNLGRAGATHKFTAWAQHFVFVILFNLAIIKLDASRFLICNRKNDFNFEVSKDHVHFRELSFKIDLPIRTKTCKIRRPSTFTKNWLRCIGQ